MLTDCTYTDSLRGLKFRYRKDGKLDRRYRYVPDLGGTKEQTKTTTATKKARAISYKAKSKKPLWIYVLVTIWATVAVLYIINAVLSNLWSRVPSREYLPTLSPYGEEDADGAWNYKVVGPPEKDGRAWCQTEYEKLVCAKDWDSRLMVALMYAESGANPDRVYQEADGTHSTGLFQINSVHSAYTDVELRNPARNVDIAYTIYKTSGVYPWGAYTDGRVWEFYK